jgi:hypothetical protein
LCFISPIRFGKKYLGCSKTSITESASNGEKFNLKMLLTYEGEPALRLRLGRYIPVGENMVRIYGVMMKPGELISYDYTMKMYNGEI